MENAKEASQLWVVGDADIAAIEDLIKSLHVEVDASTALLSDLNGQVLIQSGALSLDQETINFLSRSMAIANRLTHLLGEEKSFDLYYHDGERYDIYAALVVDGIVLSLFFDRRKTSSRIGIAWLYMKRAIKTMREYLDDATIIQTLEFEELVEQEKTVALTDVSAEPENVEIEAAAVEVEATESPPTPVKGPGLEIHPPSGPSPPKRLLTWEEAQELGLVPKNH